MRRQRNIKCTSSAFSLTETMVVIGIISLLAAMTIPGFINLAPSRKAQISEISGFLELARTRAIALQQDVYVCFADDSFPEEALKFRGMTLFMASSLSEEIEPVDTRDLIQKEPWFQLSADTMFGIEADFGNRQTRTLTVLDSDMKRNFTFTSAGQVNSVQLPYLLFSKSGRVEVPAYYDSEIYVALVEGFRRENGVRVVTGEGERLIGELIVINPKTGKGTLLRE